MNWKPVHWMLWAGLSVALVGCAGYGPGGLKTGDPAAEVERQMGPATGRYSLPGGGTRLEFARGPMGLHTYMVDLDVQQRVVTWAQVLSAERFATVQPGMSREALLLALGRPAETYRFSRQNEDVWNYRYDNPLCWWFVVSLDIDGPVRATTQMPDPRCDKSNDPDRLLSSATVVHDP
jgi:hypothetical protein